MFSDSCTDQLMVFNYSQFNVGLQPQFLQLGPDKFLLLLLLVWVARSSNPSSSFLLIFFSYWRVGKLISHLTGIPLLPLQERMCMFPTCRMIFICKSIIWSQSTASQLFVRTGFFHRTTFIRPGNKHKTERADHQRNKDKAARRLLKKHKPERTGH